MRKFALSAIVLASILATGCTRIQTGEVGVRVNISKQVEGTEFMPGEWKQTVWGDILTFPTKDISVTLENKTPMTADNTALEDFDVTATYTINPTAVAELYSTKNRTFHAYDEKTKDILLMYNRVVLLLNNASYKAVREYKALDIADYRKEIEGKIQKIVNAQLTEEKVGDSVQLTDVAIRSILPNKEILKSATDYVKAQNELKIKQTEVDIAKKESERMAALSSNSQQSIAYMQAQAQMKIAEGIREGKVNTIVVPMDFKGMVNVK